MSNMPLVSILIPAYNARETIRESVESALQQTWAPKEVIVVDDGSTDGTLDVLRDIKSDSLQLHRQANSGASVARNHAYSLAKGDYIQYLDADDIIAPNKISLQVECLESNPGHVSTGSWGRFHDRPENARFKSQPPWRDYTNPADLLRVLYNDHYMMHPACWLVPRAIADAAGPWDERLSLDDDGEYFARVVVKSKGIRFVADAKSYYRSGNPNSLSGGRGAGAWESQFLSMDLSTRHLLSVDDSPEARAAVANRFQRFVYLCWPDMPELVEAAEQRVMELGGSNLQPSLGGNLVNSCAGIIGWRLAKRMRLIARRFVCMERRS
ncbi:MAG: glycosyltransferase family 2 protein [Candidatus Sumerlaeia bacterium]|nr:glycosyltransferase family 2 protein [Candidatus Sumerlaeia bacterium]